MSKKSFYADNAIKSYHQTFSESFQQKSITPAKIKRVSSVSTARINSQKFNHRQVFNHQLYSEKPFKIAVQFKKEADQKEQKLFSLNQSQVAQKIIKILSVSSKFAPSEQNLSNLFKISLQNCSHHLKSTYNQTKIKEDQIVRLKDSVLKIIEVLCKQLQNKQSRYLQLLYKYKVSPINQRLKTDIKPLNQQSILRVRTTSQKIDNGFNVKTQKTSQNGQNQQQRSKYWYEQKIKALNQKIRELEFMNNKSLLLIESLQQKLTVKQKQIQIGVERIKQMEVKVSKVKQIQDGYTYKIRKLKEQLQVAHIVKQQNLAEKMRYILQI